jgi:hypothetical protein
MMAKAAKKKTARGRKQTSRKKVEKPLKGR